MNERLGHYEIVEELGRGGMGVVYKGYEPSLGRYVAIKVLAAAMAHDPVFVERFLREARAMAALNDPHIIQIYFIGQDEDQTFFVMEFIDGESLSDWLKRDTKLPPADALKVLHYASQGLATAHAQGVIHRDIKPGNIMITTRGQVKVADFGIALASNDVSSSKLTNTGALVGTPGYLSPEVCLGKAVDQRSDIFALGIVLFEMLTGRMPFNSESPLKLMLDVVEADIPDIRELNPEVDEETTRILARMLAKNPAERYQSCDDLNADLRKHPLVATGGPLQLRPWTASDASKSTMIGIPTPVTRDSRPPRMATPPPQVGSRSLPQVSSQMQAPNRDAATMQTPAPMAQGAAPAPTPARGPGKLLLVAGVAVVVLALAGWGLSKSGLIGGGDAVAEAPVVPVPAAPPPTSATNAATDAATNPATPNPAPTSTAVTAPVTTDASSSAQSGATPTPVDSSISNPATADASAGETLTTARVERPTPIRDRAAEAADREVARRRRLAAALEARRNEAQSSSDDESDSSSSDDDNESGGGRATAAQARRAYLCRTQKKC